MSVAIVHSRALSGFDAPPVAVEVHLSGGLPAFNLVGLPETEVRESRDRVRAALQNAQFEFPARRITVNLAPADLPKESGRFDLPIALGILVATGQIPDGFASSEILERLRQRALPLSGAQKLTPRERECLSWVASGKTDWEISQILNISEQTAHEYVQNALIKLNATTRAQAVATAIFTKQMFS